MCSKKAPLDPTQGMQDQIVILVNLTINPEVVAPGDTAVVQAYLFDQVGQPVAGELIEFTTSIGTIVPTSSTTNDSGVATTIFTAPAQTGEAIITGHYGTSQKRTVTVEVKETAPQSITLIPEAESLLANGLSTTTIRSIWLGDGGEPLKGIPVTFEASVGIITSSAVTDSFGVAEATLTSAASRVDTVAQITARGFGTSAATQVLFKGISFTMSASPVNIIADGRSTSRITVVLKETSSDFAVGNASINFGADLGTIPNSATTNASGVATVELTSSTQTGVATVTAVYGQALTETIQVIFDASRPTYLNVSAEPPVILADNQSTSSIKAVVSDQNNNPVPDGIQVNFEIIDGTGTIESKKVTTAGMAVSTLTSGTQPDTAAILVRVSQLSDTVTVRYVVGEAATITVVADSTSLPADGITSTSVIAYVFDAADNPVVDGTMVSFVADVGDITPNAQTNSGRAVAQFSSSVTGIATIRASVGAVFGETTIELLPGPPNSILLSFEPNSLGVKDSGRNQTLTITADVVDSKNNPVLDGTLVSFSIFSSPGGGEFLSSTDPIPTLNGKAQVSLNSGIRSGSVRILAQVTDSAGVPVAPEVRAVSTEIIIFAGPPYIEDVNDASTSHLSVGVKPLNVFGWNVVNNTATVTAVVGDKFNNPVPPGTAVFFTTSAGVISTHTGFTDEQGVATVTIHTAQPYPTITRFYNTFFDPNENHPDFNRGTNVIPGPIPDFEGGEVLNSIGDFGENDGVARILAVTEGVDANGNSARVWSVTSLVFSGLINVFDIQVSDTDLSPGESAVITFKIYDVNGNPIVPGSEISIRSSAGELSWTSLKTSDPGITHYQVLLTNDIDPTDPDAQPATTSVTIEVRSANGNVIKSSESINLKLN
ncbi:MAG: invasin domain 3-containing protein [bacterium]